MSRRSFAYRGQTSGRAACDQDRTAISKKDLYTADFLHPAGTRVTSHRRHCFPAEPAFSSPPQDALLALYPLGGSGRLGEVLSQAVTRYGGEVLLKAPVAEIRVEKGAASGIRLASGQRIAARAVISNADLRRTFLELVPAAALPAGFRQTIAAAQPAFPATSFSGQRPAR
jgi:hypothetical protein